MKKRTLAVIMGRFQNEDICLIMDEFIKKCLSTNDKVLILLGLSPVVATKENPLDFETRKLMLQQAYPDVGIAYVKDNKSDEKWVADIDTQVSSYISKHRIDDAVIYGGQYTFYKFYNGLYTKDIIPQEIYVNNELQAKKVASNVKATADFRAGVIWATRNQYPKVYPTVDIAVMDNDQLLLARKPDEDKLRFIGGFVDPNEKFEDAAKREVMEEANITVDNLQWMGTFPIDDFRYLREVDKITTTFFVADYVDGIPRAQDDIAEIRWVNLNEIDEDDIVPNHRELFNTLVENAYDDNGNFIL